MGEAQRTPLLDPVAARERERESERSDPARGQGGAPARLMSLPRVILAGSAPSPIKWDSVCAGPDDLLRW